MFPLPGKVFRLRWVLEVSLRLLIHFAKANLGLAALPTALGDAEPNLVRVLDPITELTRSWRMLTTRQLRRTPRVAAFFAFVASEAQAMRQILTG